MGRQVLEGFTIIHRRSSNFRLTIIVTMNKILRSMNKTSAVQRFSATKWALIPLDTVFLTRLL